MFNKEKIKWIAVFTALALLFVGVISALAVAINNKPDEKEDTALETVNDFAVVNTETDENAPVMLPLALSDKSVVAYTVSGLSESFKIWLVSSVERVTLSKSEVTI